MPHFFKDFIIVSLLTRCQEFHYLTINVLYNRCTGICKFGNNAYPRRIRRRSNLGHIFQRKKSACYGPGNTVLFTRISCLVVIRWPLTIETWVHSRVRPCENYGQQSDTGTGFSLSTLVVPCQCHSTNAPYSPSSPYCSYQEANGLSLGSFQRQFSCWDWGALGTFIL